MPVDFGPIWESSYDTKEEALMQVVESKLRSSLDVTVINSGVLECLVSNK